MEYLSAEHQVPADAIQHHHYHLTNDQVARHLFTVSCGLDSISGRRPDPRPGAQGLSAGAGVQSHRLGFQQLFPWAVKVGKRARTETRISQGAASIGFAAVELAKRVCGDLRGGTR